MLASVYIIYVCYNLLQDSFTISIIIISIISIDYYILLPYHQYHQFF